MRITGIRRGLPLFYTFLPTLGPWPPEEHLSDINHINNGRLEGLSAPHTTPLLTPGYSPMGDTLLTLTLTLSPVLASFPSKLMPLLTTFAQTQGYTVGRHIYQGVPLRLGRRDIPGVPLRLGRRHIYQVYLRSERHPGGYIPLFSALRDTLVGMYHCSPPERHPGGYTTVTHLRDTLVGIPPLYTRKRHPGGYTTVVHPEEAPWWVGYTLLYTRKRHPGG